jgi:hypothetical protein
VRIAVYGSSDNSGLWRAAINSVKEGGHRPLVANFEAFRSLPPCDAVLVAGEAEKPIQAAAAVALPSGAIASTEHLPEAVRLLADGKSVPKPAGKRRAARERDSAADGDSDAGDVSREE